MQKTTVKNDDEWLALRKSVITATESASLIGANPFKSMEKAWEEKNLGTFAGNAYTLAGQILEPAVVKATNVKLGRNFRLFEQEPSEKVFYVDPVHKLGATPDAFEDDWLLECKTTKPVNLIKYSLAPPPYYIVQLQTQMHCTGIDKGILSMMSTDLSPSDETSPLPIIFFEVSQCKRIEELLCQEAVRFFNCLKDGKKFRQAPEVKKEALLLIPLCYKRIQP